MDSVYGLSSIGCGSPVVDSKGAAIHFAVLMSVEHPKGCGSARINYRKAKKLFDFICSNVKLPEVKQDYAALAESLVSGIKESINSQKKEVCAT